MKKVLAVLILVVMFSSYAKAECSPPIVGVTTALPNFWLFSGALTGVALVEYLDVEGVSFPLCGVNGWTCQGDYPEPVHKDGV